MTKYFPAPGPLRDYCNNVAEYANAISQQSFLPEKLLESLAKTGRTPTPGDVKYVFYTRSGPGPIPQPQSEALLSPQTGLPVPAGPRHKQMKVMNIPPPQPITSASSGGADNTCNKRCPFSSCKFMLGALIISASMFAVGRSLKNK